MVRFLIVIISIAGSLTSLAQPSYYTSEMSSLIRKSGIKPAFENYKPQFSVIKDIITFRGPNGSFDEEKWFILDGKKYVAVYSPGDKPSIDFTGNSPLIASESFTLPVRHHNSTLLGTRLTTSIWYDKWAISGDDHKVEFSKGGDTITLTESQRWTPESQYKRNGRSVHSFTFRCDPYFGYIAVIRCYLETDDPKNKAPEFINFMPPDVANPWPWKNRFAYTIYSDNDKPGNTGYTKFANNLAAGNLSDEDVHNWGKGFSTRSGGLVAMADENKWSPALFRKGDLFFSQRTCDVWLDQHNLVHFPEISDKDGFYRLNPTFIFVNLPPDLSTWLIRNSVFRDFKPEKQVMIRLGIKEDFEDQPLPMTYPNAALTKGFWEKDFVISEEIAHSGKKSMLVKGVKTNGNNQLAGDFIHCPQIPLEPDQSYLIESYVNVEGDSTRAFISADYYEWSPGDKTRILSQRTNAATQNRWQKISLFFTAPDWDPFVDLRFNVAGKGRAWFDDFSFIKLTEQEWTIADTVMDKSKPLAFRMWIPEGVKHIRGLILASKVRAEEEFVINPSIRKVAAEENLAIIKSDSKAFAMFDITKGEDVLFLRILKKLAVKSGYSEIEFAPWLTFGHSTAGHFAKNLAYWKPERTFGIIYFKSGQFHSPVWTRPGTSIRNIPILAINGQFEEYGPLGNHPAGESWQKQWLAVRDTFMLMRKTGHLVSLIVEPGEGHSTISQKDMDYMALFIKKAAQYKIPENAIPTDKPVILNDLKESQGVLTDTSVFKIISYPDMNLKNIIRPFKDYPEKQRNLTFWHFDNEMADAWLRFHQNKTK